MSSDIFQVELFSSNSFKYNDGNDLQNLIKESLEQNVYLREDFLIKLVKSEFMGIKYNDDELKKGRLVSTLKEIIRIELSHVKSFDCIHSTLSKFLNIHFYAQDYIFIKDLINEVKSLFSSKISFSRLFFHFQFREKLYINNSSLVSLNSHSVQKFYPIEENCIQLLLSDSLSNYVILDFTNRYLTLIFLRWIRFCMDSWRQGVSPEYTPQWASAKAFQAKANVYLNSFDPTCFKIKRRSHAKRSINVFESNPSDSSPRPSAIDFSQMGASIRLDVDRPYTLIIDSNELKIDNLQNVILSCDSVKPKSHKLEVEILSIEQQKEQPLEHQSPSSTASVNSDPSHILGNSARAITKAFRRFSQHSSTNSKGISPSTGPSLSSPSSNSSFDGANEQLKIETDEENSSRWIGFRPSIGHSEGADPSNRVIVFQKGDEYVELKGAVEKFAQSDLGMMMYRFAFDIDESEMKLYSLNDPFMDISFIQLSDPHFYQHHLHNHKHILGQKEVKFRDILPGLETTGSSILGLKREQSENITQEQVKDIDILLDTKLGFSLCIFSGEAIGIPDHLMYQFSSGYLYTKAKLVDKNGHSHTKSSSHNTSKKVAFSANPNWGGEIFQFGIFEGCDHAVYLRIELFLSGSKLGFGPGTLADQSIGAAFVSLSDIDYQGNFLTLPLYRFRDKFLHHIHSKNIQQLTDTPKQSASSLLEIEALEDFGIGSIRIKVQKFQKTKFQPPVPPVKLRIRTVLKPNNIFETFFYAQCIPEGAVLDSYDDCIEIYGFYPHFDGIVLKDILLDDSQDPDPEYTGSTITAVSPRSAFASGTSPNVASYQPQLPNSNWRENIDVEDSNNFFLSLCQEKAAPQAPILLTWNKVTSATILTPSILSVCAEYHRYFGMDHQKQPIFRPASIEMWVSNCDSQRLLDIINERKVFNKVRINVRRLVQCDQESKSEQGLRRNRTHHSPQPQASAIGLMQGQGSTELQLEQSEQFQIYSDVIDVTAGVEEYDEEEDSEVIDEPELLPGSKPFVDDSTNLSGARKSNNLSLSMGSEIISDLLDHSLFLEKSFNEAELLASLDEEINQTGILRLKETTSKSYLSDKNTQMAKFYFRRNCRIHLYISTLIGLGLQVPHKFDRALVNEMIQSDFRSALLQSVDQDEIATLGRRVQFLLDLTERRIREATLAGWHYQTQGSFVPMMELIVNKYLANVVELFGKFFDDIKNKTLKGLSSKVSLLTLFLSNNEKLHGLFKSSLLTYQLTPQPQANLSVFMDFHHLVSWYSAMVYLEMRQKVDNVVARWMEMMQEALSSKASLYEFGLPWLPQRAANDDGAFFSSIPEDLTNILSVYIRFACISPEQHSDMFSAAIQQLNLNVYCAFTSSFGYLCNVYAQQLSQIHWDSFKKEERIIEFLTWVCSVSNDCDRIIHGDHLDGLLRACSANICGPNAMGKVLSKAQETKDKFHVLLRASVETISNIDYYFSIYDEMGQWLDHDSIYILWNKYRLVQTQLPWNKIKPLLDQPIQDLHLDAPWVELAGFSTLNPSDCFFSHWLLVEMKAVLAEQTAFLNESIWAELVLVVAEKAVICFISLIKSMKHHAVVFSGPRDFSRYQILFDLWTIQSFFTMILRDHVSETIFTRTKGHLDQLLKLLGYSYFLLFEGYMSESFVTTIKQLQDMALQGGSQVAPQIVLYIEDCMALRGHGGYMSRKQFERLRIQRQEFQMNSMPNTKEHQESQRRPSRSYLSYLNPFHHKNSSTSPPLALQTNPTTDSLIGATNMAEENKDLKSSLDGDDESCSQEEDLTELKDKIGREWVDSVLIQIKSNANKHATSSQGEALASQQPGVRVFNVVYGRSVYGLKDYLIHSSVHIDSLVATEKFQSSPSSVPRRPMSSMKKKLSVGAISGLLSNIKGSTSLGHLPSHLEVQQSSKSLSHRRSQTISPSMHEPHLLSTPLKVELLVNDLKVYHLLNINKFGKSRPFVSFKLNNTFEVASSVQDEDFQADWSFECPIVIPLARSTEDYELEVSLYYEGFVKPQQIGSIHISFNLTKPLKVKDQQFPLMEYANNMRVSKALSKANRRRKPLPIICMSLSCHEEDSGNE